MARTPTRVYGGVKAADRRAERRAKLIEAGLELLGTEGWKATTVRAICAHAGLTARYFYESFPDRDALLLAVFDELAAESAEAVLAAVVVAEGDAHAKAEAAIAAFVKLITEDPRKARVLFVEAIGSEQLARRRFETLHGFAALVAEQGRMFYDMPEASDPMIDLTAYMLVGGLSETFIAWLDGSLRITMEQLIADCRDLFVATGETAAALVRARALG
jgi:AcrR family transcriptional regulator